MTALHLFASLTTSAIALISLTIIAALLIKNREAIADALTGITPDEPDFGDDQ